MPLSSPTHLPSPAGFRGVLAGFHSLNEPATATLLAEGFTNWSFMPFVARETGFISFAGAGIAGTGEAGLAGLAANGASGVAGLVETGLTLSAGVGEGAARAVGLVTRLSECGFAGIGGA